MLRKGAQMRADCLSVPRGEGGRGGGGNAIRKIKIILHLRRARHQQSDGGRKLLPRPANVTNVMKHLTVHEINGIHNINISVTAPSSWPLVRGWNLNQPVNNFVLRPLGSILAIKTDRRRARSTENPPQSSPFRPVLPPPFSR